MSNADTAKYIKTNIRSILTALGWKIDDLSTIKSDMSGYDGSHPACMLILTGEDFEENYGEAPLYNELSFTIAFAFKYDDQDSANTKAIDFAHALRDGIKTSTLNVAGLATTQYVSNVDHAGYIPDYQAPACVVNYRLIVRYREV